MTTMAYQFENLFFYAPVETRKHSTSPYAYGYGEDDKKKRRDNDRLLEFTLRLKAEEESQNNWQVMIDRCREVDAKFLVIGPYGIQLVFPETGDELALSTWSSHVFDDQYFESINAILKVKHEREEYHYYSPRPLTFSKEVKHCQVRSGSYARLRSYEIRDQALRAQRGVWSVETGKKLKWQDAVTEFWKLGFATERSVVRYAGRPQDGSADDIRAYSEIMSVLKRRNIDSTQMTTHVNLAMKRINRAYTYPNNWRELDREFGLDIAKLDNK